MESLAELPRFSALCRKWYSPTQDQLTRPFFYFHRTRTFIAPKGFISDGDSVPRIPFVYAAFKGRAKRSAWVHDYLYRTQAGKAYADRIFLDAMKDEGVPAFYRYPIYWAVVYQGARSYAKYINPI